MGAGVDEARAKMQMRTVAAVLLRADSHSCASSNHRPVCDQGGLVSRVWGARACAGIRAVGGRTGEELEPLWGARAR